MRIFLSNKSFLSLFLLSCCASLSAQTLTVASGNGQLVLEQFKSTMPLVVQAKGPNGAPLAGIAVTFAIAQGQGTLIDQKSVTDANGQASTNFVGTSIFNGSSTAPTTISATSSVGTANFIITTASSKTVSGRLAPPPLVELLSPTLGSSNLSGRAGSVIPGAVVIRVTAQSGIQAGTPVPNVGVRIVNFGDPASTPSASCVGGTILTNANGLATCDLQLGPTAGTATLTASVGEIQTTPGFSVQIAAGGGTCSYALSAQTATFGAGGGPGSVNLGTGSGCTFTATSGASFITITGGANGTGNGTISYTVSPNTGTDRTGSLTIAGQTYTISQSGTGPAGGASGPLSILTAANLPDAFDTGSYSYGINVSGGKPPYSFAISGGALPAAFTLNRSTGLISGFNAAAGSFSFTVLVTDSANATVSATFSLKVIHGSQATFAITNASFGPATLGQPYQQLLTSSGGCVTPFSPTPVFTLASGALPPGLGVNPAGGSYAVSGTPTTAGTYQFSLGVKEPCGQTVTQAFSIVVNGATTVTPPTAGNTISANVAAAQFSLQSGSLSKPADQAVTLSSTNGPVSFTASVGTTTGGNLFSVSPASGTTPATLVVSVNNASALPQGTYQGVLTINPQGGLTPILLPLSLTVTPPASLQFSPVSLSFVARTGSASPDSQTIALSSTGADFVFAATAQTRSGGNWLSISPVTASTPQLLTVSVNSGGLARGSYGGSVVITTADASRILATIPVTLSVQGQLPVVSSVTNAASFLPGPIAPGEFVTLFGTGFGPDTLTPLQLTGAGLLDTSVAQTRVLFDGIPAPIVYTSASQVTAIVPYALGGRASTRVQVEYQGVASDPFTVAVNDSAPAVFTVNPAGQGAILNEDGSVNSAQNGAAERSIIVIYATGEGLSAPTLPDGSVIGTILPSPNLPVSVTIGGLPADVVYAGAAPGLPAGVFQVNARVPVGVPHRPDVSVSVGVGVNSSQAGVTVAIKP